MLASACAFLLGTLLILQLSALPHWLWLLLPLVLFMLWLKRSRMTPFWRRTTSLLLAFAMGALWCAWTADVLLRQWIDPELENLPLAVSGQVVGLPSASAGATHFEFLTESGLAPKRLRLGWYDSEVELQPGQQWRMTVKLKRPHGFANPGGFDYERWLFEKGVGATGSVVADPAPLLFAQPWTLDRLRDHISGRLQALSTGSMAAALLPALAVGDRRGLEDEDWEVLRRTGTSHLVAISGLHIGLVAALGFLLGRGLCLLLPAFARFPGAPRLGAALGLLLALIYAALAGFSLPTLRALIMLVVVLSAVLFARATRPGRTLGIALLAVLLLDPLSPLSGGFWLSFAAVAALMWALGGREKRRWIAGTALAQWAVTLMMLPLAAGLFGQAVLIAPLVNFIAIPITAVLLVPLSLLTVLLLAFGDAAAAPVVQLLGHLLEVGWQGLEWVSSLPGITVDVPPVPLWSIVLACLGALLLLLPRGLPVRWLGPVFAVPLFFPVNATISQGSLVVTVLDVGQGLSVLVRTSEHSLLYDAGPRFHSGFDAGEAVVVPALRYLGVSELDRLVLSHADADHAGGYGAVSGAFPIDQTLSTAIDQHSGAQPCLNGQSWTWDGIGFSALHPMPGQPYLSNDSSCVLTIDAPGGRLLLPGDISELVERRLLRDPAAIDARLLVAAHHGSDTSSSQAFIDAVSPEQVAFSAGYLNRFDMPRESVRARFLVAGANLMNTAEEGAITWQLDAEGQLTVNSYRREYPRLWRAAPPQP